ncbi:PAS domain-containing protein [Spirillospora sp. NPDC049024]
MPTRRSRADAAPPSAHDEVFSALIPVLRGLRETFGHTCEAVLHDYRKTEHSVIAVSGEVTGRQVNSAMSEIGLRLKKQGDAAEDDLNYVARMPDGRLIKSSTILLRDSAGHVFGALCLNIDVTRLVEVQEILQEVGGVPVGDSLRTYTSDPETIVHDALTEIEREMGRSLVRLSADERVEVLRRLDERGVFQIRRAMTIVSDRMGISRASGYKYLARLRSS